MKESHIIKQYILLDPRIKTLKVNSLVQIGN